MCALHHVTPPGCFAPIMLPHQPRTYKIVSWLRQTQMKPARLGEKYEGETLVDAILIQLLAYHNDKSHFQEFKGKYYTKARETSFAA